MPRPPPPPPQHPAHPTVAAAVSSDGVAEALNAVAARLEKIAHHAPGLLFQFELGPGGPPRFRYVSERIGELVMRELKRLDKIAYVRFASVYRSFEDVDEFADAVQEVQPRGRTRSKD